MAVVCLIARASLQVWFKPRALCRIYLFKVFSQPQQHRGEEEKPWGFFEWSGGAGSCAGLVLCEEPSFWSELDLPEQVREEDVGVISVHSLPPTSSELVAGPGVIAVAGTDSWELSSGMRFSSRMC